jgi:hypothetical protein
MTYDSKNNKPLIAGILLIIAGLLGIYTWITASFFDLDPTIIESLRKSGAEISIEQLESILAICSGIGLILSIFPILSGILSIKRKNWSICIVMSIIGLFTIGPFFLSSFLSLIGLILIALSKNEFNLNNDINILNEDNY